MKINKQKLTEIIQEEIESVLNEQEELYYEKYGIIYSGSDLGSCINSLF